MMNRRQALQAAFLALGASEIPLRSESLKRTTLMSQDLSKIDKDMVISIAQLEYEPGGASEAHRHPGHTFVYVLEGALVGQVDDGPVKTYKPGQMFYEPPMHLHAVSRNASQTEPVKFLVIRVAEKGAPGSVPAK
jgi:quercetin dioxygenase-like cupin family protein